MSFGFPSKKKHLYIFSFRLTTVGWTYALSRKFVHPTFPLHSWHFRLLMQLKWHWMTTEHNHLQSLSCPWGASTLSTIMAPRLLQPPPRSTGLSLQVSPAGLHIPLWQEIYSTSICSGSVSHKHSTASATVSHAQQHHPSHWHFKPHHPVQGTHEMQGRDLNSWGLFSG